MIITDYYRFDKLPTTKSATRYDCTNGTASHPDIEMTRNAKGELFLYITNIPLQFGGDVRRKADKCLTTTKGKNLSSLFVPDVTRSLCFGDCKGTSDALLLSFEPTFTKPQRFEVFVCRGQRNNRQALYNLFAEGELDTEVEAIRQKASTL